MLKNWLASVALLLAPSLARAELAGDAPGATEDRPIRRGFTFELGLGGTLTHVARERMDSLTRLGVAPLSISIGGFITPKLAVLAREAGTTYFTTNSAGERSQIVSLVYCVQLQYWATDVVSLSAGPGFAVIGGNPLFGSGDSFDVGIGGSARLGYAFLAIRHHIVRAAWETFNSKVDERFVFGTALTIEWQYF